MCIRGGRSSCKLFDWLPHPGQRSEDLDSLPPASEGSCPVLGGAGPARSSSPRRMRLKPLKAGRPRSRGSLLPTLHPQPESCISAGASGVGTKSRNPKDRSLPPFSFQDLHVLFRLQFSEKKTVGLRLGRDWPKVYLQMIIKRIQTCGATDAGSLG